MKAAADLVLNRGLGDAAGQKITAGLGIGNPGNFHQFVGNEALHICQFQSGRRDGLQVQVEIGVAVAGD